MVQFPDDWCVGAVSEELLWCMCACKGITTNDHIIANIA